MTGGDLGEPGRGVFSSRKPERKRNSKRRWSLAEESEQPIVAKRLGESQATVGRVGVEQRTAKGLQPGEVENAEKRKGRGPGISRGCCRLSIRKRIRLQTQHPWAEGAGHAPSGAAKPMEGREVIGSGVCCVLLPVGPPFARSGRSRREPDAVVPHVRFERAGRV